MKNYTVYIEQDEDGVFVGSVPSIPGCHTQGDTMDELLKNLREVISLCVRHIDASENSRFVGIQNIEVPA
jgi:predicted RNase H-like HicB family nuclease